MKKTFIGIILLAIVSLFYGCAADNDVMASFQKGAEYAFWKNVGTRSANEALDNMKKQGVVVSKSNLIVMSNAGYAEVNGYGTMAALDGLTGVTTASRGNTSLLEIHSSYNAPLWFAIYEKNSGMCAYLQINPSALPDLLVPVLTISAVDLFSKNELEQINSENLYKNAIIYNELFANGVFGGNEFRIVTIMNSIAQNAPTYSARAFEFHDHYCPGVTSGILMVNYLKKNFQLNDGGSYFVHGVQPWCKEDALMTLLNATPGKTGYAVLYSTQEDRDKWKSEAKNASTIIYRQDGITKKWDGIVFEVTLASSTETKCPDYGTGSIMTKLCADLWYLDKMNQSEKFVKEIKRFNLPDGIHPKDWARPGIDPIKKLEEANLL